MYFHVAQKDLSHLDQILMDWCFTKGQILSWLCCFVGHKPVCVKYILNECFFFSFTFYNFPFMPLYCVPQTQNKYLLKKMKQIRLNMKYINLKIKAIKNVFSMFYMSQYSSVFIIFFSFLMVCALLQSTVSLDCFFFLTCMCLHPGGDGHMTSKAEHSDCCSVVSQCSAVFLYPFLCICKPIYSFHIH